MENNLLTIEHGKLINLHNLETLTGITYKTLKKRLAQKGIKPKKNSSKGSAYEPKEALLALYSSSSGGSENTGDLTTEKARLAKFQADKTKLEAEKLMGTLVDREIWCNEWGILLLEFKDKILAAPMKIVPKINGRNTDETYEIINNELKGILNELADDSKRKADEIQFEMDSPPDDESA